MVAIPEDLVDPHSHSNAVHDRSYPWETTAFTGIIGTSHEEQALLQ